MVIADIVITSVKSGVSSVEIEYAAVAAYCKKFELDEIDTFKIIKRIVSAVYKK